MRLENHGGDVLASGGSRAQFQGPKVSQERWDEIFKDWEPEVRNSDAGIAKTGDGSVGATTDQSSTV